MAFCTYIIYSTLKNKYYCGISNDINKRLREHNAGKCRSTKYGIPWTLVFYEESTTRETARTLEVKIKNKGPKRFFEEIDNTLKGAVG